MNETKVSDKYQLVLPKKIREKQGIKRGQIMIAYPTDDGGILLKPKMKWPDDYIGSQKDIWSKIDVQTYIRQERDSWDND